MLTSHRASSLVKLKKKIKPQSSVPSVRLLCNTASLPDVTKHLAQIALNLCGHTKTTRESRRKTCCPNTGNRQKHADLPRVPILMQLSIQRAAEKSSSLLMKSLTAEKSSHLMVQKLSIEVTGLGWLKNITIITFCT